jgi:carboxymethylenebutenolidase
MASAGFAVVMPDLFTEGSARTCLRETFRALMTGRGRAFVDIESARGWIADRADTTGSVGVIGFCMGGGFALMTAARGFDVASINYGRLPDDLGPVLDGACPIVASYGGSDRSIRGAADRLEHELADRAIVHDVREYPAAGHSFMNDPDSFPRLITPVLTKVLGIGPDPDAAADSWRRIVRFFGEHLASSSRQPD